MPTVTALKKEAMLEELRETCELLGYRIRFEKGDFAGGHCILKDQQLLVVNKRFTIEKKLATIARAIGEIGVEGVFLKPAVRAFVEDEWSKVG